MTASRLAVLLANESARGLHVSHDVMRCVADELGATAAWLYRVTADGLDPAGTFGLAAALVATVRAGIAQECVRHASPQTLSLEVASAPDERALLEQLGASWIEATPLCLKQEVVGVLVHSVPEGMPRVPEADRDAVAAVLALAVGAMHRNERAATMARRVVGTVREVIEALLEQATWQPRRPDPIFGEAPDFDERAYLTVLARGAAAITKAQMAAVGVGNAPNRRFDPWIAVGVSPEVAKEIGGPPRPVGTLGAVAIGGETVRVPELSDSPKYIGLPAHHPPVHSFLATPIRIQGRSFGNVYLANKEGANEFSETDEQVMQLLAALAALGLHFTHLSANEHERTTILQILESAPDGLIYLDKRTGHLLVSRSLERMYGRVIEPGAGIEQQIGYILWPDGRPLERHELPTVRALSGETVPDTELVIVRPDGERIPVSHRSHPFMMDGAIRGALTSVRDLSSMKESERVREEFAAMVVHDLRNPIQSMLLQIQSMRIASEKGKPTASDGWDRLVRSAKRLSQMATDMLDSTRIELARVPLSRTSVDLAAAVRHVVDNMRSVLGAHRIVVDASAELPPAMVDVVRFDQILMNLLDNAAKNSEDGTTIRVSLRVEGNGVEIAVRDQGIGISPDELPKLFDRLHQAKRARERHTGLGLGLHIAKGLTEAHGGRLRAESIVDRGSTFRVWLPSGEGDASHSAPSTR
jgi:PAS domain S-box-containing protein